METIIDILGYGLGYGIITIVIAVVIYVFVKLLTIGLDALTKNDD
jgi:Na+-transporting NADH:ubiquinone oxidoreductase subunit NqrD